MKVAPTWPWPFAMAGLWAESAPWGKAPTNRGKNTTLFAAMTHQGLLASMTVEGAANTEAFLTYLDAVLCPAGRPGQVLLMDNLQVHKAQAVRQRIEACGCRLVFLPRYSPGFQSHRGCLFEAQDVFTPGTGPHARGLGGGHRRGAAHDQGPRRPRLVQTLRLLPNGSSRLRMGIIAAETLGAAERKGPCCPKGATEASLRPKGGPSTPSEAAEGAAISSESAAH